MKISEICIKNPVGTILVIIAVFVLGFFSIPGIPVSFWPEFVAPTLIVLAPYPGVGPEEIEEQIARPLEEEFSTIDGVEEIETTCIEGICRAFVRFGWGVDFDEAKINVQDRTNRARSRFPRGVLEPQVLQVQDFLPPGIELGFYSERRGLNEIRDLVDREFKNRLLRLTNVANVQTFGGFEQHVAIRVNPERLAAYGLTLGQINQALVSENINTPAGKISSPQKNYYLRTLGKFTNLDDIATIIVAAPRGVPVYLQDVAQVSFENKERETITRLNGKELVGLAVREKSGGNTVAMCDEVKAELVKIQKLLPADVKMEILRDQSIFIKGSIQNVVQNAFIGAFLAGIIIFLFLGNLRNTLIIAISIPISIVATFVLIDSFGLTINTISLGGLALGVGMIVDASIVVLENIFRHLQDNPSGNRVQTVVQAVREVGMAITASTLTSIVVFLPLAFLVGLFAVLLGELAITVVFSLSLSIVVALTIVPMLSHYLMRTRASTSKFAVVTRAWQYVLDKLLSAYRPSLRWALRHRLLTVFIALVVLVASVRFITPLLDVELLPSINEGEFRVELNLPEGTRLEFTDKFARDIERYLIARSDVEQTFTTVGLLSVRGELKPNVATVTVKLKPDFNPQIQSVMAQVRQRWQTLPGARLVVRQTDVTEGMKRDPVNIRLVGDDLKVLGELGQKILAEVEKEPGVVNARSSIQEGLPQFGFRIDRARASDLGLTTPMIASAIRTAILGASDTRLSVNGEEYDITLKMDEGQARSVNEILDLPLTTLKGQLIPLRSVVSVVLGRSPSEIMRIDQQRILEIKADVSGRSQRQVAEKVRARIGQIQLPANYYLVSAGQSKAIQDSFTSLLTALVIAIFLVYVVMGAQFNSFLHPFTIAFTIPLALIGFFLGLAVFGASISMNALLGMIMLVGIVVNNGILLIDFINQLRAGGLSKNEAIVEAGATRLRPILITSLTTVFGMLPIALGLGQGGEALQPLGAVVAGGLITSTFLTLIVIPCLYSLLDRLSKKRPF